MRTHVLAAVLHVAAGLPPGLTPPGAGQAPPFSTQLNQILAWCAWIACAACVAGVLVVAGMMALKHQRGEAGQHVGGLGWVLGGCILIGTAAALVGSFT